MITGLTIGVTDASAAGGSGATTYYACLNKGKLTHVGTSAPKCLSIATLISWNSQGQAGPQGPAGATGQAGPTGPAGAAGPAGATGATGATGSEGTQGPAGPTGPQGPAGTNGTNGTNGISQAYGQNQGTTGFTDGVDLTTVGELMNVPAGSYVVTVNIALTTSDSLANQYYCQLQLLGQDTRSTLRPWTCQGTHQAPQGA